MTTLADRMRLADIDLDLTEGGAPARPRSHALLQWWEETSRIRGGMPARGDLDPADIKPLLETVFLIEFRENRPIFTLVGTGITLRLRRDFTGEALDGAFESWTALALDVACKRVRAGELVTLRGTFAPLDREAVGFEWTMAPLKTRDGSDVMIFGVMAFDDRV